jgi:NADH-quinone oxidoreductase subunit J
MLAANIAVPDGITFALATLFVIGGALGVVMSRNPVHAALSLVLTLFGVAVLFVEQDADFLAAVQVIVYAGAIVVLFLFVIMFLGVDHTEEIEREQLVGQRALGSVAVLVAIAGVFVMASHSHWVTGASHVAGPIQTPSHGVYLLGKSIFTTYLLAFEATAALLVIAVVGAVVLARKPRLSGDDEGVVDDDQESEKDATLVDEALLEVGT